MLRLRVFVGFLAPVMVLLSPASAHAEMFRSTFVVAKPTQFAGTVAVNRAVDAIARQQLIEQFIRERLSAVLVRRREEQVRIALEPLADLIKGFNIVRRSDVPGDMQQVVCEADIDTTDVLLRLVNGNVLSFGEYSPRLLLWPGPGSAAALQALRGRISEQVRATGVTLLATEAVAPVESGAPAVGRGGRPNSDATAGRDAILAAATDAGANFVALINIGATPTPIPGVGLALDVNIQYTLMRPSNAAILGERTISARGGGANTETALQRVLADQASTIAKGLAGDVATAIFKNGRAIDPDLPPSRVMINVAGRPNASATSAFLDLLRQRGFAASLGTGRAPSVEGTAIQDRIEVDGRGVTVEEVFDVLANTRFGQREALLASVFAHGTDYLSVELVDVNARPAHQPITAIDGARLPSTGGTTAAGVGQPQNTPPVPQSQPVLAETNPSLQRSQSALPPPAPSSRAGISPSSTSRPLEFEFSEAFKTATRPAPARMK